MFDVRLIFLHCLHRCVYPNSLKEIKGYVFKANLAMKIYGEPKFDQIVLKLYGKLYFYWYNFHEMCKNENQILKLYQGKYS